MLVFRHHPLAPSFQIKLVKGISIRDNKIFCYGQQENQSSHANVNSKQSADFNIVHIFVWSDMELQIRVTFSTARTTEIYFHFEFQSKQLIKYRSIFCENGRFEALRLFKRLPK